MKRLGLRILVVSLLLVLSLGSTVWTQSRIPLTTKWEYWIETGCTWPRRERLEQLGQEGWELVAATGYGSDNGCQGLVFKRPLAKNSATTSATKPAPTPIPAPGCTMTLEQSPTVRGLHLGLSATELAAILPDFKPEIEAMLKQRPTRQSLAMANLFFQIDAHYAESEKQKALSKQFAPAATISINFYKGKIAQLRIEYRVISDLFQWNTQNWIQKLAESYDLPNFENWQKLKSGEGFALTCAGFEVQVPNYASPLSFTLTDTQAVARAKQWLADEDARLRREFKP